MLSLKGIKKKFGSHPALMDVDLDIAAGEIHGLVGLNGSGKSTLLHLLFGSIFIHETGGYDGNVFLNGNVCTFSLPAQAIAAGVGMVHQELALIPEMTVAANIMLTREKGYAFTDTLFPRDISLLDSKKNNREALQSLQYLNLTIDPSEITGHLSLNIKQFIEIAREVTRKDLKLLLLDEPTAVLNREDANYLLLTLRNLAKKGVAILFISHRLQEIFEICDRLTVLKDGKRVCSHDVKATTLDTITQEMSRGAVAKVRRTRALPTSSRQPVLKMRDFSVDLAGEKLHGLDLDIHRSEILGLISLSGHGKLAFGTGMSGRLPFGGSLYLDGEKIPPSSSSAMMDRGIFFLSEDRNQLGFLKHHSVMDNIAFSALQHRKCFLHPYLPNWLRMTDRKAIRLHAEQCIQDYDISCSGPNQPVGELSGGNQQKVRIAHALTLSPRLLIVNEPTRGIDLAAKERVLNLFLTINEQEGMTIVIASSEVEELQRICDRIVVLYQGRLHAILEPTADEQTFSLAISGEELRN